MYNDAAAGATLTPLLLSPARAAPASRLAACGRSSSWHWPDWWKAGGGCRVAGIRAPGPGRDGGVEAAATHARLQHVPQAQPTILQQLQALRVRQLGAGAAHRPHDAPELVAWMRVVLLCGE